MRCLLIVGFVVYLMGCGQAELPDPYARWASYAGTVDSAQYSSLKQIDRSNVAQLDVAWIFASGAMPHRCSPLIIDDLVYVVANGGVTAIRADNGTQVWHAPDSAAQNVRGLSYWENSDGSASDHEKARLLVVKQDALWALDARTGDQLAGFGDAGRIDLRRNLNRDPETINRVATMTPGRVFENLIIVGSAVGDETYTGAPGDIRAYDVRDGKLVWSFHTIPHPGEYGYDTWPEDAWMKIGAANAWSNMALDEARGIVFVPTGAPSYHFYGGNRVGDNLFANTLLALDARTGQRLWHFQAVHHDIWDYDLAMGPKLLTVQHQGRSVDAVALAGKHGFLFVFDRENGNPLFPIEERAVPASDVPGEVASPTQPWPTQLPPFARITLTADELSPHADAAERDGLAARIRAARNDGLFTPPSLRGSVSAPGSRGGAQFGNGAVIPDAGLFFHAVIESPTIPKLEERGTFDAEFFADKDAEAIYASTCAVCHRPDGAGQPPLTPALAGVSDRLTDQQFAAVLQHGRGRMAAYPDIPAAQVAALRTYVSQLNAANASNMIYPPSVSKSERPYRSGYHHFFSDNGLIGPPPWSKLMAWNLNTGEVLWEKPYGDVIALTERGITGTGSLFPTNSLAATAGGLLFSVTNDRKIRAWDQTNGAVLWSDDLPADPGGIPAIYAADGRQFVIATATRGDLNAHGRKGSYAYVAYALPAAQ